MAELRPLSPEEQATLAEAALDAEPEKEGWALYNLRDAQLELLKRLPGIAALVLFETCERGEVTDAGLAALSGLESLRQLDLGPGITDVGLAHLAGLVGLRRLRLDSAGGITDAGILHLGRLTELRSLSVQYTRIGDGALLGLRHLRSLHELAINGTAVTDEGLAHLGSLTSLRILHLGGGRGLDPETLQPHRGAVTDRGLRHLAPLADLELLSLDGAGAGEITSKGVMELAPLRELQTLILRGPGIDEEAVATLAGLTKLKSLWLTDTRISAAATERLREALPGCKVRRTNVADVDLDMFRRPDST